MADGYLEQKHVASLIHEFSDKNCQKRGLPFGMAIMVYRDADPVGCVVEMNGSYWQFALELKQRMSPKQPHFKATAEPSSLAA